MIARLASVNGPATEPAGVPRSDRTLIVRDPDCRAARVTAKIKAPRQARLPKCLPSVPGVFPCPGWCEIALSGFCQIDGAGDGTSKTAGRRMSQEEGILDRVFHEACTAGRGKDQIAVIRRV